MCLGGNLGYHRLYLGFIVRMLESQPGLFNVLVAAAKHFGRRIIGCFGYLRASAQPEHPLHITFSNEPVERRTSGRFRRIVSVDRETISVVRNPMILTGML